MAECLFNGQDICMCSATLGLTWYNTYELPSPGDYPNFILLVFQEKVILCLYAKQPLSLAPRFCLVQAELHIKKLYQEDTGEGKKTLKEYDYVHHQKRGKNSWLKNLFQVIEEMMLGLDKDKMHAAALHAASWRLISLTAIFPLMFSKSILISKIFLNWNVNASS